MGAIAGPETQVAEAHGESCDHTHERSSAVLQLRHIEHVSATLAQGTEGETGSTPLI